MKAEKKLDAKLLKELDKTVYKLTNSSTASFEIFFELLSNLVAIEAKNPLENLLKLLQGSLDIEKDLQIFMDFHNAIVAKLDELQEGKSSYHLCNNLYNLVEHDISKSFDGEALSKNIIPAIASPAMVFLNAHSITETDTRKLRDIFQERFHEEAFTDEFVNFLILRFMLEDKSQHKKLKELFSTPYHYLRYMIESSITLSTTFREINREYMPEQEGLITETYHIGEDEDAIDYSDAQRNDPCPCGSGKKYKKCCRKAQEFPLSTLKPQKVLAKPKLKRDEVAQYYTLYNKLMTFVQNDYAKKHDKQSMKNVFTPQHDGSFACADSLMQSGEILKIRDHLVENRELIERFLQKEFFALSKEEQEIFHSWKDFVYLQGIVMQAHQGSEVFVWDTKKSCVYLVYGLYDTLASIIPSYPFYGNILLFPFKGRIIFDGLLTGSDIEYGNNILRSMVSEYQECIDKNGITLTL